MMLLSMLRPLADRGHQVDWLLSHDTPDVEPYDLHGVTVHPARSLDDTLAMVRRSDVVIGHLENMPRAVTLSRMAGVPFILVMHNDRPLSLAWNVDDAAAVVLNSEWMADAFGRPANAVVIRPPVFAAEYRTTPGGHVTLVNLCHAKGVHTWEALARRMPHTRFLGVMGAYNEQLPPELPNVEIRAHGADMRSVYGSTRVLLMPSQYESWGRVGVEGMASGIPVIAHPTAGLLESLGDAGVFVDRDDVDGWERELVALQDPNAWHAASQRSLARSTELDPTVDLERWVRVVESLSKGGSS